MLGLSISCPVVLTRDLGLFADRFVRNLNTPVNLVSWALEKAHVLMFFLYKEI